VYLSRRWREKDLERRLERWQPLIGKEATTTSAHGMWHGQLGWMILFLWVATGIALQAANDMGLALVLATLIAWPIGLFCFVRSVQFNMRASRQAALVAGTSSKARPPVRNLAAFERWSRRSKYSKLTSPAGFDGAAQ